MSSVAALLQATTLAVDRTPFYLSPLCFFVCHPLAQAVNKHDPCALLLLVEEAMAPCSVSQLISHIIEYNHFNQPVYQKKKKTKTNKKTCISWNS